MTKDNDMRPIDYARQAFFARGRRELHVPEWSTDDFPFTIYYGPFTAAEEESIRAREPKNSAEYNCYALVMKAKDAAGTPLFQWGDVHTLMRETEYMVILKITTEMSKTMTEDEAKKNSVRTPGSTSASA